MLVDVTRPITNIRGEPMQVQLNDGRLAPSLVGDEMAALIAVLPTDRGMAPDRRRHRFELSIKIMQATGAIELESEDIAVIRAELDKSDLAVFAHGQVVCALEGKPNPLLSVRPQPIMPPAGPSPMNGAGRQVGSGRAKRSGGPKLVPPLA